MIRVVVADDDPDWRKILVMSLGFDQDLKVIGEGKNGDEAVSLCKEHQPDAVFLDIDMPGKSGLEVGEELRGLPGTPYLVYITGRQEHALKAFELKASDYLVKPVDDSKLTECVARMKEHVFSKRKAAQADSLAERVTELEHDSNTDPMVGAYNRRFMDARLQIETERARRHQRALSCIMLDMDKFKSVNDNHGHATGDLVLVQLCDVIRETLRTEDTLARYGGEEFLVLLPETDSKAASQASERLRLKVQEFSFGEKDKPLELTVSLGTATLGATETPYEMVERADQALYKAKNTGRNKWVSAEKVAQSS